MTFPRRLANVALVVFVTFGAAFAVLLYPGSGSLELVHIRLVYDGVAITILLLWLGLAAIRPDWRPSSRLAPAVVACLAAFAISTATSRFPRLSVEMLGYAVLIAELYLLLVAMMRHAVLQRQFENLAVVLCGLTCVLFLVQAVGEWQQWWSLIGRLALPPLRPNYIGLRYGSPNPVATVALMLGAFGVASIARRGRAALAPVLVLLLLVGAAVLVSGTRGAWLGAGAGLVVLAAAGIWAFEPLRGRMRALGGSRRGVVVAVVVVALVGGAAEVASLTGRLNTGGADLRTAFAAASLKMFGASPLVGVGPGTWQVLRAAFTVPTDIDYYIPHAHDIYVMTLAEFGATGVMAALVVFACVGVLVARALRSRDQPTQLVGLAAVFVIVVFAAQQTVDVLVDVPGIMVATALPIAWLDAAELNDRGTTAAARPWRRMPSAALRVVPIGAAAVTCLIAVGLILIESVAPTADNSVVAADKRDWHTAALLAAQAASRDPDLNVYWYNLGVSAANIGNLRQADAALTRSATTDDFTYAWLDLAAVRWKLDDTAGARQALDRAERLGWQRTPLAFAAGWLRQQLGDAHLAIADYADALAAAPLLAADPYWSSTAALRAMWPTIVGDASARAGGDAVLQLDLSAGLGDAGTAMAAQLAPADPRLYPLVIPAWNGDPAARAQIQALAESRPLDAAPAEWCQIIAMRRADTAVAQRFASWIAIAGGAVSTVPHVTFGVAEPVPEVGDDSYASLYRRPVPQELVVSILPQLVWEDHF